MLWLAEEGSYDEDRHRAHAEGGCYSLHHSRHPVGLELRAATDLYPRVCTEPSLRASLPPRRERTLATLAGPPGPDSPAAHQTRKRTPDMDDGPKDINHTGAWRPRPPHWARSGRICVRTTAARMRALEVRGVPRRRLTCAQSRAPPRRASYKGSQSPSTGRCPLDDLFPLNGDRSLACILVSRAWGVGALANRRAEI